MTRLARPLTPANPPPHLPPMPLPTAGLKTRFRWVLPCILFLGFALRVGLMFREDPVQSMLNQNDGMEYLAYARSILDGKGDDHARIFDLVRPPGYPLFLIPFESLFPMESRHLLVSIRGFEPPVRISDAMFRTIEGVQCAIDMATACIVGLIAGRIGGSRARLWTTALYAFNPLVAVFPAWVMAETVFIFLTWLGIFLLQSLGEGSSPQRWRRLVGAGIALAFACLCRPSLQAFLPVAAIWVGWIGYRRTGRLRTAIAQMAGLTVAVSVWLLPLQVRNLWHHGEFNIAPRYATAMYAMSSSREYYATFAARTPHEYYASLARLFAPYHVGSGKYQADWVRDASAFRRGRPADWWRMQGLKMIGFWRPWLNPMLYAWPMVAASALATIPTFLAGFLGMFSRRSRHPSRPLLVGIVIVGYLTGGFLFIVATRFRVPMVDIGLMVFGGIWLAGLGRPDADTPPAASEPA